MRVRRIPQTFASHNDARRMLTLLNSWLQQVRRLRLLAQRCHRDTRRTIRARSTESGFTDSAGSCER